MEGFDAAAYLAAVRDLVATKAVRSSGTGNVAARERGFAAGVTRGEAWRRSVAALIGGTFDDPLWDDFVDAYATRVASLAVVTERAGANGLLDTAFLDLDDAVRVEVLDAFLSDFADLNGLLSRRVGRGVLGANPVLIRSAAEITAIGRDFPEIDRSVMQMYARTEDLAAAFQAHVDAVNDLTTRYPDVEPSLIRACVIRKRKNPEGELLRYQRDLADLQRDFPAVNEGVLSEFAMHNPKGPKAAVEKFLATVAELRAEFPDVTDEVLNRVAVSNRRDARAAIRRCRATVNDLESRFPEFSSAQLQRIALAHPSDATAEATDLHRDVNRICAANPDVARSTVIEVASRHRDDPDTAVRTVLEKAATVANQHGLTPALARKLMAISSGDPARTVTRFRAIETEIAERHPEIPARARRQIAANLPQDLGGTVERYRTNVAMLEIAYPSLSATQRANLAVGYPDDPLGAAKLRVGPPAVTVRNADTFGRK